MSTKTYPTFVAESHASNGGVTSLVVNLPAGSAVGHTAILSVALRDDRTITSGLDDAGWANVFAVLTVSANGIRHEVWWKTLDAGDISDGSITLGFSSSTTVAASMVGYSGVTTVVGGAAESGAVSGSISVSNSSLSSQAAMWLHIESARSDVSMSWTPPAGMTERGDHSYGSSGLRFATTIDEKQWATGDTGVVSGTVTGGPNRQTSGWVVFYGSLSFNVPALPENPNEAFGFDVPLADGTHRMYAGWGGALFLCEAQLGGSGFRLNDPTYGTLNGAGRLGPVSDGWVDIGNAFVGLNITGGATQDDGVLTRFEAATARLTLKDWDGLFDPVNDASPYHRDWRVGTVIRFAGQAFDLLQILNPATMGIYDFMFGLFVGRISSMTASGYGDEDPIITVELIDDVAELQAYNSFEQSPVGAGDLIEDRVDRIVANAQWPGLVLPDVHPAWPTATFQATTLAQSAWTEILLSCDAVVVAPVVDGQGILNLTPVQPDTSSYRAFKCGSDFTGGELGVDDVEVLFDDAQLRNVIDAGRVGGSVFTTQDETSRTRNGWHRWGRSDLPLENDSDVQVFASLVLTQSANPQPRVTAITCTPQLYGANRFHDEEVWVGGSLITTISVPVWFTICRFIAQRYAAHDLLTVRWTNARTGVEKTQLVGVRGVEMSMTADWWDARFVTANLDLWFQTFTLNSATLGILDAGNRLG